MKNPLLLLALLILAALPAFAQAPARFNYQGIARNASGAALAAKNLGLRITIHNGTASGAIVYQETQSVVTNPYGLYNVIIGNGIALSGTLAGISWGTANKFIQIELDPVGGTAYSDLGTTQLLSVPYAMYAAGAGAATLTLSGNSLSAGGNTVTLPGGNTYTAGTGINISGTNVVSAQNATAMWNASQIQGYGVSTNPPSTGQVLIWSGSAWVPNALIANTSVSGTTNYVTKFVSSSSLGNSEIQDDGTSVGIGVSSLSSANQFQVNSSSTTAILGNCSGSGTAVSGTVTGTSGGIAGRFDAGTNGKSIIVPNGRVGIGTTSPTATLEVKAPRKYALISSVDTTMGTSGNYNYYTMPAGIRGEYRDTGDNDGSGVLGISTVPNSMFGVGVTGIGNFFGVLGIGTDTGFAGVAAAAHGSHYGVWSQGSSGSYAAIQADQSGSTYAFYANGGSFFNGNIAGTGTNSYSSDRKLKKNIEPIRSALNTIGMLKPSSYEFRTGEFGTMNLPAGKHYGLIAQDLQMVLPELVSNQHFQSNPKEKGFDYLSVNYNELIPVLIKGMQEQQAIIDKQQRLLEDLQRRIETLEKK